MSCLLCDISQPSGVPLTKSALSSHVAALEARDGLSTTEPSGVSRELTMLRPCDWPAAVGCLMRGCLHFLPTQPVHVCRSYVVHLSALLSAGVPSIPADVVGAIESSTFSLGAAEKTGPRVEVSESSLVYMAHGAYTCFFKPGLSLPSGTLLRVILHRADGDSLPGAMLVGRAVMNDVLSQWGVPTPLVLEFSSDDVRVH
jgi:hypothetical protein